MSQAEEWEEDLRSLSHQFQSDQRYRKFALEGMENDVNLHKTSCVLKQFRISTGACLEKRHRPQSNVGTVFYCFLPEISLQSGLFLESGQE